MNTHKNILKYFYLFIYLRVDKYHPQIGTIPPTFYYFKIIKLWLLNSKIKSCPKNPYPTFFYLKYGL